MSPSNNGPPATDNRDEAVPRLSQKVRPIPITGAALLTKLAFDGADLSALFSSYQERVRGQGGDEAGVVLDMSTILQLAFNRDAALKMQQQAVAQCQIFRITGERPPAGNGQSGTGAPLHVLALVAPGDLMVNTPIEFILKSSSVVLDFLYVLPDRPLPAEIPDHDVAFVAVSEPDDNEALLHRISRIVAEWPRPVINDPKRILCLSRQGVYELARDIPGLVIPATRRISRSGLWQVAAGGPLRGPHNEPIDFPLVVRPIGSHAGESLSKLDNLVALREYLASVDSPEYYLMPFIDYQADDGLYRKYRIVFIDETAYLCHMAVSERWMIHYLNAGMTGNEAKRREEAAAMAGFDEDFAHRHRSAFEALRKRIDLDYFGVDCGETRDGRLLVFEVDVAMVIHDMDPPGIFPYKGPQMEKVFTAFQRMLEAASHENHG